MPTINEGNVRTKIIYRRQTLYVHHNLDRGELVSAHLGGDYLDITDKLGTRERSELLRLAVEAERKSGG